MKSEPLKYIRVKVIVKSELLVCSSDSVKVIVSSEPQVECKGHRKLFFKLNSGRK